MRAAKIIRWHPERQPVIALPQTNRVNFKISIRQVQRQIGFQDIDDKLFGSTQSRV